MRKFDGVDVKAEPVLWFASVDEAENARRFLNISEPPIRLSFKFCSMHRRFHLSCVFPAVDAKVCVLFCLVFMLVLGRLAIIAHPA